MSQHTQSGTPRDRTAAEVRDWLLQEIKDSSKACELRIREAVSLANSYALGEISAEQAEERLWKYEQRWGEALPGAYVAGDTADVQIVEAIDTAKGPYTTLRSIKPVRRRPGITR